MGFSVLWSLCVCTLCVKFCTSTYWSAVDTSPSNNTRKLGTAVLKRLFTKSKLQCFVVCASQHECVSAALIQWDETKSWQCWLIGEATTTLSQEEVSLHNMFVKKGVDPQRMFWVDEKCVCNLPGKHNKGEYLFAFGSNKLSVYDSQRHTFNTVGKLSRDFGRVIAILPDSQNCRITWIKKIDKTTRAIYTSCLDGTRSKLRFKGRVVALAVEKTTNGLFVTIRKNNLSTTYIMYPNGHNRTLEAHGKNFQGNCFALNSEKKMFYWCTQDKANKGFILKGKHYGGENKAPKDVVLIKSSVPPSVCIAQSDIFWVDSHKQMKMFRHNKTQKYGKCSNRYNNVVFGCAHGQDREIFLICVGKQLEKPLKMFFYNETNLVYSEEFELKAKMFNIG